MMCWKWSLRVGNACMSTATLLLMYVVDLRHANPGLRHQHPQPFLVIYLLANQQKPKPANAFSPEVSTRYGHDTDSFKGLHMSRDIIRWRSCAQHTFFATDRAAEAAESMVPAF